MSSLGILLSYFGVCRSSLVFFEFFGFLLELLGFFCNILVIIMIRTGLNFVTFQIDFV